MTPNPPAPVPPESATSRGDRFLPWRWAGLGWAVAALFLVVGVPLFLRMPLWCDANLYDTAAYNLLAGGVLYRDVFDTNLPGFVWLVAGARRLFGPSSEAIRAVDLAVVAAVAVAVLRFARMAGATCATRAWAAAGMASFYPFISEFNHLQRDVWMMVPVLGASLYRFRRLSDVQMKCACDGYVFRSALLEGTVWGMAFWVKPHVAVMAAAAWLALAPRLAGTSDRPLRRLFVDLVGTLAGAALVGLAGVAWLVSTGTLQYLADVFQNWNTQYLSNVIGNLDQRYPEELSYFPPWSLATLLAVPLAALNLLDGRVWSRSGARSARPPGLARRGWRRFQAGPADDSARLARALYAAIYLAWVGTALVLQRPFHYVHVPEVLLAFGLFAANGWAVTFALLVWQLLTAFVVLATFDDRQWEEWGIRPAWDEGSVREKRQALAAWHVERRLPECGLYGDAVALIEGKPLKYGVYRDAVALHPALNPDRLKWWPASLRGEVPRALRNGVAFDWDFHVGVDSVQLGAVEDFLRERGVGDGELICWHDSPHALYRRLGIRPGFRFMHVTTASEMGEWQYREVRAERDRAVRDGARYVVADLYRVTLDHAGLNALGPDGLPTCLLPGQRAMFPLNQEVAFRSPSGRYVALAIARFPLGECRIPRAIGEE